MWIPRWVLIAAATVLVLIALVSRWEFMPCDNIPLATATSPSGHLKAVVFVRSCGATTTFATHVSVLDPDEELGEWAGNVFAADAPHPSTVARNPSGGPDVRIAWKGSDTLVITYAAGSRLIRQVAIERTLAVQYDVVK